MVKMKQFSSFHDNKNGNGQKLNLRNIVVFYSC